MTVHGSDQSCRTLFQYLPVFLFFSLLCGCTLVRPLFAPEPLPVLDVTVPNAGVSIRQRITMSYGKNKFSFQSVVELHNDRMVIVGISSYSTTLFTIRIRDGSVKVDAEEEFPFDLERFATDLQWSLWPSIPEREGFSVVETRTEDGFRRRIYRNGSPAGTVDASRRPPWSGDVRFTHPDGYTLHVKHLSTESLSPEHDL